MLVCRKPRIFDIDLYVIIAALAIAALTWFVIIGGFDGRIMERRAQAKQLRQQRAESQTELERLQELDRRQQALAAQLSRTPDILAQSTTLPQVIRSLGQLAAAHALTLEELTPDQPLRDQFFSHTPLTLRLTGAFPQLYSFLCSLDQQMPYARVASLQVNAAKQTEKKTCDIALDLHVFSPAY